MKDRDDKKNSGIANKIINGLIIFLTLLILFFTGMLIKETFPYVAGRKEYKELQQFVFWQEEATIKSEASCPLTVDFETLWKVNPDIKGWLYLEALGITYPVVQGKTNDDYIYTSVKGTANNGGSIFVDYRNKGSFKDPHTLIYGHNMKDGSMFGKLKKLYDQKFVDEWDGPLCFWIITPEGQDRYDIFSIRTVPATGEDYTLFSEESEAVAEYLNKSARQTQVALPQRVYDSKDKAITLSTCTGRDEFRLVIQGVLHIEQ